MPVHSPPVLPSPSPSPREAPPPPVAQPIPPPSPPPVIEPSPPVKAPAPVEEPTVHIKADSSDHFQIVDMWDRIRDGVCKAQRFKAGFLQHSVADGVRDGLIEVCLAPTASDPASPTVEREILVALTRVCRLETGLPAGFCLVRGDADTHESALQRRSQERKEPEHHVQPAATETALDTLDEREWTKNPKVRLVLDVFNGTLENVRKAKNATAD